MYTHMGALFLIFPQASFGMRFNTENEAYPQNYASSYKNQFELRLFTSIHSA